MADPGPQCDQKSLEVADEETADSSESGGKRRNRGDSRGGGIGSHDTESCGTGLKALPVHYSTNDIDSVVINHSRFTVLLSERVVSDAEPEFGLRSVHRTDGDEVSGVPIYGDRK